MIAGFTAYDLWRTADGSLSLGLTGKIKFGTADETAGLGSGETDYSLQTGVYKSFGRSGLSTGVGYRARGDTVTLDLENVWFAYVGGLHSFSSRTQAGAFFDFREASIAGNDAVQELSAFISRAMNGRWAMQVYLIKDLATVARTGAAVLECGPGSERKAVRGRVDGLGLEPVFSGAIGVRSRVERDWVHFFP